MPGRCLIRLYFLLCTSFFATATAAAQTPEMEIRSREEAVAQALVNKDAAALEQILGTGFVFRGAPDVARDAWIKNVVGMCWGTYEIVSVAIIHSTDDFAVASVTITTRQDPATCESAEIRSVVTDVWAREGGTYRLVMRHGGPAAAGLTLRRSVTPPPARWERTAELSLVATGGNTDTQTVGIGAGLVWRPGAWVTRGRTSFVRSVTGDAVTAESFVAEIRQSRRLSPRAEAFARVDYLVDRFAGIDDRTTVDGGLGWTIVEADGRTIKLDGGAGVTHEVRLAGGDETFAAGTASMQVLWRLTRTTNLDDRTAFSIDLASPGNWRLQHTAAVSIAMTRLLSFKLSHDLKHVAQPVEGFEKTDTIVSAALVARF